MNLVNDVDSLIVTLTKIVALDDNADNDQSIIINNLIGNRTSQLTPLLTRMWKILRKDASSSSLSRSHINNTNHMNRNDRFPYCYVCKVKMWKDDMRHSVHAGMCWLCGNLNINKRDFKKDLTGKIAIVTGGRVKIGYETAIRLLRNGCIVIVTSRFVDDCLDRYQKDADYNNFKNRLFIYQLNMLSGENINNFITYMMTNFEKVDYLINNAAQTIKRPIEFFNHLLVKYEIVNDDNMINDNVINDNMINDNVINDNDQRIVHRDKSELLLLNTSDSLLIGYDKTEISQLFPSGEFDMFGQQIDLRTNNSWMLEADEVPLQELAEVYIVNSIAPYMISTKLKSMLSRTKEKGGKEFSWIVNVTSMEGVFAWDAKPSRHPHTNMAKAALNMFTRTCGQQFIKANIVMICVDTGWNNPQHPNSYDFKTPVDCIDGAARILDPVYRELKQHSVMYKDYKVHPW